MDEVVSRPGSTSRARARSTVEGAARVTVTRWMANGPARSVIAWWTTPRGQVAVGRGRRRPGQGDRLAVAGAVRAHSQGPRLDLLAGPQGVGDREPVGRGPLGFQVGARPVGGDPGPEGAVHVQGDGDRAVVVVVDRPADDLGGRDRLQPPPGGAPTPAPAAATPRAGPVPGRGAPPDTLTAWPSARWWATAKRHGPPSGSRWPARAYPHSRPSTSIRSGTGPSTSSPVTRPRWWRRSRRRASHWPWQPPGRGIGRGWADRTSVTGRGGRGRGRP
jgi:hypothetical protein